MVPRETVPTVALYLPAAPTSLAGVASPGVFQIIGGPMDDDEQTKRFFEGALMILGAAAFACLAFLAYIFWKVSQ